MKRILIFTVTAGSGHNSIACSIEKALRDKYNQKVEIKKINFYIDYNFKFKSFICDNCYRFVVKHFRKSYNLAFKLKQKYRPVKRLHLDTRFMLAGLKSKIIKTIEEFKPNFIFCSHFFPAIALSQLKKEGCIRIKNVPIGLIVSDYVVCPFIEQATNVDYIFTFSNSLKTRLMCVGFKEKQIQVFPPPCKVSLQENENYLKSSKENNLQTNRQNDEFNKNLKTDKNKMLTFVAMTGDGCFSGLIKNIKNTIKSDLNVKLILLNGKNEKQKLRFDKFISKTNQKNKLKNIQIKNCGFVSDEELKQFYLSCDAVITKCGLNSMMEVLNFGKLLITTEKLAEQERQNVFYYKSLLPIVLLKNNKCKSLTNLIESKTLTNQFFEDYKVKLSQILKPNANDLYADFIYANCL